MEHFAPHLIGALIRHGYLVILLIMVIEEAGVPSPIPGDGLLLAAGYLAATGRLSYTESLATVVGGALVGASILYWIARRGGRALVQRYGRVVRIDDRRLDQLHGLFERLGPLGPGVARLIPGLRIYTSALTGLAKISYPLFLLNVLWAGLAWGVLFMTAGYYFGDRWREYLRVSQHLSMLTVLLVIVGVGAYFALHFRVRQHA